MKKNVAHPQSKRNAFVGAVATSSGVCTRRSAGYPPSIEVRQSPSRALQSDCGQAAPSCTAAASSRSGIALSAGIAAAGRGRTGQLLQDETPPRPSPARSSLAPPEAPWPAPSRETQLSAKPRCASASDSQARAAGLRDFLPCSGAGRPSRYPRRH
eukprot:scaffold1307_cov200-Pinguiococcus_pyrenoidosus.AAC.147